MTLIEKIKALFSADAEQVSVEKFLDAKLVDGTIVRTDAEEFKAGDQLYVITEAGEKVNAPEGMHELENGTILVVDGEGKITEVRTPDVKVEDSADATEEVKTEMAETVVEETPAEEAVEVDEMKVLAERVAKLEEAMMILAGELEMKKTEMSAIKEENSELKSKIEAPIVKPTETKKFEKILKQSNVNKIKVNAELLNKISAIRNK